MEVPTCEREKEKEKLAIVFVREVDEYDDDYREEDLIWRNGRKFRGTWFDADRS